MEKCVEMIAKAINHGLDKTEKVKVVLENMSRQGNTIGGDFKELKMIIDLVKDKSRIGVCIDTCHAMAAGMNLNVLCCPNKRGQRLRVLNILSRNL